MRDWIWRSMVGGDFGLVVVLEVSGFIVGCSGSLRYFDGVFWCFVLRLIGDREGMDRLLPRRCCSLVPRSFPCHMRAGR